MRPKILIVDNDPIVLACLMMCFETAGFETHPAFDGNEGLRLAMQELPDALVFDYHLPMMDGVTMLARIREAPWAGDMVAVLYSRSVSPAVLGRAGALDACLWKALHTFGDVVRAVATAMHVVAGEG